MDVLQHLTADHGIVFGGQRALGNIQDLESRPRKHSSVARYLQLGVIDAREPRPGKCLL